jgi:VWFA-related protein
MRRLLAFLLAPLLAVPQQQTDITFKSSTNLVIVNVIVRDKQGKPIEGLTKEDFALVENGKPQTISVFDFQRLSLDPAPPPLPTPVGEEPKNEDEPEPEPAKQSSERFKDRRLLVLFFDFAGMQIPDQLRAQDAALQFIEQKLTTSDLVQVMSFASGIRIDQEFTDDRTKLVEAIKKFRIGDGLMPSIEGAIGPDGTEPPPVEEETNAPEEIEFDLFNTDRKLGALEYAVQQLAPLPEKKAFIYFSSGAGGSGSENQAQLRSTVNAAVRANVSFYPVDVRGLIATPPGGGASESGQKGTAVFTGKAQRSHRDKLAQQQETLSALASDTGGKALLDSNDLTLGMTQAQRDLQSYYTLGYYSSDATRDGRFRRIQLKIASQPNARLDFRSGYFGEKDWSAFSSSDRERQLQEAIMMGDPLTDLPLALEVNWFRLNPTKFFVPVSVKVPGSGLTPDNKPTEFDFIGQVRDSKGRIAASVRDGIKLKLPSQRSLLYDTGFTVPPGTYRLKFLVRESTSGKMGTFETRFTIPEQPAMSSVVWSSQREPLNAALASVEKNKKVLANHPLIRDGQKLVPSVTKMFRAGQKVYVYVEAYDPQGEAAATVSLFRGQTKVMESAPVRAQAADTARAGTAPLQFQIPLDGVRPGRYVAQVTVIDPAGQKFGFERTALVIAR